MLRSRKIIAPTVLAFAILLMVSGAPAWACDCLVDGRVDVGDMLYTNQIASGLAPVPSPVGGCDVDGTGTVTILDVLLIAQYLAGNNPTACDACAAPPTTANQPLDEFVGVDSPTGVEHPADVDATVKVEALGEDD